jgi:hypothetical protein
MQGGRRAALLALQGVTYGWPPSTTDPTLLPAREAGEVRKWERGAAWWRPLSQCMSGGVLLSHNLSVAVPSALKGLTSGFGMGPGVSLSPWPP